MGLKRHMPPSAHPRSRRPYRKNVGERAEMIDNKVTAAQAEAAESMSAAAAEPHDLVRADEGLDAYDRYEALCREYGVCREFSCLRRTQRDRCTDHRRKRSQPW